MKCKLMKRVMGKIETEPMTFWDDMNWASGHYAELVRKYPGKWVAIVDRIVVAVGDSIKSVRKEALLKSIYQLFL